jgi:hypothetical protein
MGSDLNGEDFKRRLRHQIGIGPDPGTASSSAAAGDAVELVKRYVGGAYTGSAFDVYGRNDPFAITSDDLIAIGMLSIQVAENSTSAIRPSAILELQIESGRIASLLNQLPLARDLHTLNQDEFDSWLGPGSPGEALYNLIRRRVSFPRVATHKLLARKRPQLLPIRDTVVEDALGMAGSDDWWRPWWEALRTEEVLVSRLRAIRQSAGTDYLSLLRVADIVIWLQNKERITR